MSALDRHIKERKVFKKLSKEAIYCNACDERVHIKLTAVKHCITSHEKSQKHMRKLVQWTQSGSQQQTIRETVDLVDSKFNSQLARFMSACNIPWYRANSKPFRSFFQHLGKKVPDERTLRRQVPEIYREAIDSIRNDIGDSWIYLQIDESRIADRGIVSVLVGRLDGHKPISHCINIVELDTNINNTHISQIVNDSLHIIWPDTIYYDRFRLLVTDQAKYMLKAGQNLKLLYPKLLHITCICHALHRVCEKVHSDRRFAKKFVEKLSKVLSRCPRRQNLLSFHTGAPMHPLPVITRWGTWLSFCAYLHLHLDKIKEFIAEVEEEDNNAIAEIVTIANSSELQQDLIEIQQFQHLVRIIKQLEESGLNIYQQKRLLDEARDGLPDQYKDKLQRLLLNNPDIDTIFNIESHESATNYSTAPLTSVDVERSFSILKNILTVRRQSFTEDNFKMYAVSQLHAVSTEQ